MERCPICGLVLGVCTHTYAEWAAKFEEMRRKEAEPQTGPRAKEGASHELEDSFVHLDLGPMHRHL